MRDSPHISLTFAPFFGHLRVAHFDVTFSSLFRRFSLTFASLMPLVYDFRSVVLWQYYPNGGVDARNQFDMIASLPGGMDGVREMVGQFEAAGVK